MTNNIVAPDALYGHGNRLPSDSSSYWSPKPETLHSIFNSRTWRENHNAGVSVFQVSLFRVQGVGLGFRV